MEREKHSQAELGLYQLDRLDLGFMSSIRTSGSLDERMSDGDIGEGLGLQMGGDGCGNGTSPIVLRQRPQLELLREWPLGGCETRPIRSQSDPTSGDISLVAPPRSFLSTGEYVHSVIPD